MPRPRPPSRVEPLTFPVFGISWFADDASSRASILAYTGGGGSARTGVNNRIVIIQQHLASSHEISTGDQVGVALHIYRNPVSNRIWMVVALGNQVHRYSMPEGTRSGGALVVDKQDGCNALAVNAMADKLAVGCESGLVKVYPLSDDEISFGNEMEPLYVCEGHTKTVCALAFSMLGGRLLSSAKDGTARVWNDARCLSELKCSVQEPNQPPPRGQVLVRGCVFADLQGNVAITVASARRGKAFLSQWINKDGRQYECAVRTACSNCPISAMSMSQDANLMALGSVDGSVTLWSVNDWKPLKTFKEVHDLPVTCIAARPLPIPLLQGEEEDGVTIHARSASADSQLACLTLQRRAPKRKDESGGSSSGNLMLSIHRLVSVAILLWILSPIAQEARQKCETKKLEGFAALRTCLIEDVLIAPSGRPGISTPPY